LAFPRPDALCTSRRRLPPAVVLARAAPGLLFNEGKGVAGSPPF
jgi:hypothetical protein